MKILGEQLKAVLGVGVLIAVAFAFVSCAQMDTRKTIYVAAAPISELKCNPAVFVTKEEAEEKGEIEEMCSVTAKIGLTLSDKSAVDGLKTKVCECGATDAYVVRTEKGMIGNKTATMIGFRYKEKEKVVK